MLSELTRLKPYHVGAGRRSVRESLHRLKACAPCESSATLATSPLAVYPPRARAQLIKELGDVENLVKGYLKSLSFLAEDAEDG